MPLIKDIEYWLALAHVPLFPINFIRLIEFYGDPRAVFEAKQWLPNWAAVEQDLLWLDQKNNHVLTLFDANYPFMLAEIYDPPFLLFVKGDCQLLNNIQLAIVGTRRASGFARQVSWQFAKALSDYGFSITGGLSLGIEMASHQGALAGSGKSVGVAFEGLEYVKNTSFTTLVSEISPYNNMAITAETFKRRSRIISGLSVGILVVEAPANSHALYPVDFALEQGREVFAMPGSVYNPLVKSCHKLIQDGAKLVETVQDIFDELEIYVRK
jgi:DNA processing protein